MLSRHSQIKTFLQHTKSTTHLSQIQSLLIKSALNYNKHIISHFILTSCSISLNFTFSFFNNLPVTPQLFSYNTLIKSCSKTSSTSYESLNLFIKLLRVGLKPDKFTYPFVIKACGKRLMVGASGALHSMVFKDGLDGDKHIGNTLVRMYASFGFIGLARKVFDEMRVKDVVSWSSMIAGYVSCNSSLDAIEAFQRMKLIMKPNSVTLVSLLSACTHLLNIRSGKAIHSYIIINQIQLDVALGTALLEVYSMCGQIEQALCLFSLMSEKNLQSWTIMISCLADNGLGEKAIELFTELLNKGTKPDSMLFSAVLSACSHLGLVAEGQRYFDNMVRVYDIKPTMEHYGCMVDLLGRAGLIDEAYEMIRNMPMEPNSVIIRSFLGACRSHDRIFCLDNNLKMTLLKLEPELGANYVLSANVSSLSGCWNDAADIRVAMKQKGMKKVPGCSWVEVIDGTSEEGTLKIPEG